MAGYISKELRGLSEKNKAGLEIFLNYQEPRVE
jgi:hypothetical protein